nr:dsRNase1 [Hyphantria cunea]
MGLSVMLAVFLVASAILAKELPDPSRFALELDEDEFEDYLDVWLKQQEPRWANVSTRNDSPSNGCTFRINGDFGQPQPVYIHKGTFLQPNGNSGQVHLDRDEQVTIACTGPRGRISQHTTEEDIAIGKATCVNNNLVSGYGWLYGNRSFNELVCAANSVHEAQATNYRCFGNNLVIRVGFVVNDVFQHLFYSCFDQQRMEVLYVSYDQTPENSIHQTGVTRPSFAVASFFPGVSVNNLYTQVQQRQTIAEFVGQELADKYVTSRQFLARGHLAAKTDFVFATGQRATFYFINVAPQWQPFNAGNWNWLEQNLRARIGAAGYRAKVYTGTFGVSQLRDKNNRLVSIFLDRPHSRIPVPLYFYKVVYDPSLLQGTAFVSINNPYYTETEVRNLTFCTDRCRNNSAFSWLRWQPDRIDIGYSFCCSVDDFRRTVPHLPYFKTIDLLA